MKKNPILFNEDLIIIRGFEHDGKAMFEILDGRKDQTKPIKMSTRAEQGGIKLEPPDVARLLKGDVLEFHKAREGKSDSVRLVFSTGVGEKPWKDGEKSGVNRFLNISSVFAAQRANGEIFGYTFTHPADRKLEDPKARRSVLFYKTAGGDHNLPISPADAYTMLKGGTVVINGVTAKLGEIVTDERGTRAKLDLKWPRREVQFKQPGAAPAGVGAAEAGEQAGGDGEEDEAPFETSAPRRPTPATARP